MSDTFTSSFKKILPQLSNLVDTCHNWLNRKAISKAISEEKHAIYIADELKLSTSLKLATKATNATPIDTIEKIALAFSEAVAIYKRPDKEIMCTLKDFKDVQKLQTTFADVLRIAETKKCISPEMLNISQTLEKYLQEMPHGIALRAANDCVVRREQRNLGSPKSLQLAQALSYAVETQSELSQYIDPELYRERLEAFCASHNILKVHVILGSHWKTPILEEQIRREVYECGNALMELGEKATDFGYIDNDTFNRLRYTHHGGYNNGQVFF